MELKRAKEVLIKIDFFRPHRVMTRDEYDVLNLKGLHSVCHDYDGTGGTAIWMRDPEGVVGA